jgi:hypothetical protein
MQLEYSHPSGIPTHLEVTCPERHALSAAVLQACTEAPDTTLRCCCLVVTVIVPFATAAAAAAQQGRAGSSHLLCRLALLDERLQVCFARTATLLGIALLTSCCCWG